MQNRQESADVQLDVFRHGSGRDQSLDLVRGNVQRRQVNFMLVLTCNFEVLVDRDVINPVFHLGGIVLALRLAVIKHFSRIQLSLALKRRQWRFSESCTIGRSKASEFKELMLPRDAGDACSGGIGAP